MTDKTPIQAQRDADLEGVQGGTRQPITSPKKDDIVLYDSYNQAQTLASNIAKKD